MMTDEKNLDVPQLLTKCMKQEWGFVPGEKTRARWIKEGVNGVRLLAWRGSDSPWAKWYGTRRICRDFCAGVEESIKGQHQSRSDTRSVDVKAFLADIEEL